MTRGLFIVLLCGLVAACTPRGEIDHVPRAAPGAIDLRRVFVATNRNLAPQGDLSLVRQTFGADRARELRYGWADISIPPGHKEGEIEWPGNARPDPSRHFVTRDGAPYEDKRAFLNGLTAASQPGRKDVVLFVHGFNVRNAEAVYRVAQVAHDFDAKIPIVLYSWASAGRVRGYVYDRDSVMFSRDGLAEVLRDLTGSGWRVTLVAHSMGAQLTMEALRQASIAGDEKSLTSLRGVALISPDIDEDVFVQQALKIKPFPEPFLVLVSKLDSALSVSAWLTGKPWRLGSIQDKTRLAGLPIRIVDLSNVAGGDRRKHLTALTAPEAIKMLYKMERELGR
ncbi:alpha/beta hydrolase [Mameliella sediminis]|uniref:alpha/beta hydrolase n=1 Tax=Mameliella sediminis TaxID=2836866 RepID=UPI001C46B6E1|nr:alpha/beta fold hydrolase [Mameliella sediminis]MBY6115469.1 alpha/beta fold hydrolase [Antarctobacter heliothermus]MBY6145716.1 alpha/beta fold hydrolase [Mameliella alba]MBV7393561.1 alpha/beta fold hydrolase [Mameliella sediminis]MBY6161039.1 alpha/beta fold hydrolase [Mameliella alba]MBY6169509.1 alpha/beta fold hydrolase [Mameliella alba]